MLAVLILGLNLNFTALGQSPIPPSGVTGSSQLEGNTNIFYEGYHDSYRPTKQDQDEAKSLVVPQGTLIVQPYAGGESICVNWAERLAWPYRYTFRADFDQSGNATNVTFDGGSADMGTSFSFVFPKASEYPEFKNIEAWKSFAKQARTKVAMVGEDVYVYTTPFTFLAYSVALDHSEHVLENLIFQQGNWFLTVPVESWKGEKALKPGEKVLIGQDGRAQVFFPSRLKQEPSYEVPRGMEVPAVVREDASPRR